MNIYKCMYHVQTRSWINKFVCKWYTSMNVNKCRHIVQTRLYTSMDSCLDNWLNHVHTLSYGHTVYIRVHTLYMGTTYYMHIPLLYMPLHTGLYSLWNIYVLCYQTGVGHSVQIGFIQGYTSYIPPKNGLGKNGLGRWVAFLSIFTFSCTDINIHSISMHRCWHISIYVILKICYRKATHLPNHA